MGGCRNGFLRTLQTHCRGCAERLHREGDPMVRSAVRRPATKKAFAIATSAALAFAASIGAVGTAQAATGTDAFTATVTPTAVDSGVAHTSFAVTITNSASSQDTLGSALIQPPSDFTHVTASVTTSASAA